MCCDGICRFRARVFGGFEQSVESRIQRLCRDGVGFGLSFGQGLACENEDEEINGLSEIVQERQDRPN